MIGKSNIILLSGEVVTHPVIEKLRLKKLHPHNKGKNSTD